MKWCRQIMKGRHSPSINARRLHITFSLILSSAALAIGGYISKNDSASFFNLGNLFGHGLFVIFLFPIYCVFFYWASYPFFRVPKLYLPTHQARLPGDNSWISVVLSLVGFLIPPFALVGIIAGHLTLIRLRTTKSARKGRLALTGLILGHITLGLWVCIFLTGFLLWGF